MYKFIALCCSVVFMLALTACSQDKPEQQESTPQVAQQQQPETSAAPTTATPVTGKVLETMDAAGYTYLNVETDTGPKWIAVNQTAVTVGEDVTFMDGMVMQNFFSKTLDRTFPEIVFSSGLVGKDASPSAMPAPEPGAGSFCLLPDLCCRVSGGSEPPGSAKGQGRNPKTK